jgi:tRNA U34 2-thiouridine synthase MnmA/TrmU
MITLKMATRYWAEYYYTVDNREPGEIHITSGQEPYVVEYAVGDNDYTVADKAMRTIKRITDEGKVCLRIQED